MVIWYVLVEVDFEGYVVDLFFDGFVLECIVLLCG